MEHNIIYICRNMLHILRYCADRVVMSVCADLIASNKRRKKTISRNKPTYYGVIRLKRNKGKISAFCVHYCILLGVDGCNRLGGLFCTLFGVGWLIAEGCKLVNAASCFDFVR